MSEKKKFVQRIGLVGLSKFILKLTSIFLVPVLTKNLPIEDYGSWALLSVTVSLIPWFTTFGLKNSLVRFLASTETKKEKQEIFYSVYFFVLIISAVFSVLIYLFSAQIASVLFANNIFIVEGLAILVLITSLNGLFLNFFRAINRVKKHTVFEISKSVLSVFLSIILVLMGYGLYGAVSGKIIGFFLIFILMKIFIIKEIGISIPRFKHIREHLYFGMPTIPGMVSNWIVTASDRYLIGFFLGIAFVGYYSPGYLLGDSIYLLMFSIAFMLPVTLSKLYDKNATNEIKNILSNSLKYYLALSIPAVFGLTILSKSILYILTTTEIASQGYLITPIIAISALINGFYGIIYSKILFIAKRTKIIASIWIIASIINIILNLYMIPFFGVLGAAYSTLLSFFISTIIAWYYSKRILIIDIDYIFIIKVILASAFMSFFIIQFKIQSLISLIFVILAGILIYFILLLILKGWGKKEIRFFWNLFNK